MVEKVTRRQALALSVGQSVADRPARLAPREQLVNVLEYEAQARLKLGADTCLLYTSDAADE